MPSYSFYRKTALSPNFYRVFPKIKSIFFCSTHYKYYVAHQEPDLNKLVDLQHVWPPASPQRRLSTSTSSVDQKKKEAVEGSDNYIE